MREETHVSVPVVGGSSLLVIFAVLCLTVFALLGLTTVRADGRLSQAGADAVAAYYEADTQAEEIFARLRAGEFPENVMACACGGVEGYTYTCPISDTQQLVVELHRQGDNWTVLRWQAESTTGVENFDQTLDLWDGTLF